MREARKFRMNARNEQRALATGAADLLPTDLDIQNIDAFAVKLTEAIALLKEEIAGINAGKLNIVSELYEQKASVLKWLELKMPLVEPFMNDDVVKTRKLPDRLAEFKEAVTENSALLSRMALAAGTIVREIEKASQRHSLNGLYGKSGRKINDTGGGTLKIDREF